MMYLLIAVFSEAVQPVDLLKYNHTYVTPDASSVHGTEASGILSTDSGRAVIIVLPNELCTLVHLKFLRTQRTCLKKSH